MSLPLQLMDNKEIQKHWATFVEYAKSNGYLHYIGNLSFVSYKSGDIVKLVGKGKVSILKRNEIVEAEIIGENQ